MKNTLKLELGTGTNFIASVAIYAILYTPV
jgi:hypothetical protein